MKNMDIFLNTGIFSGSVATPINFYDWLKVKNFPKRAFFTRKKSLSSCYGYIDLIKVKNFCCTWKRCSFSTKSAVQLFCGSSEFSRKLQRPSWVHLNLTQNRELQNLTKFFYRPMMSNVVIFDSIDSKGLFKDVWHNYTHFKYRIGVLLCLFWYIVSNYLKWHFLEYSVDQIS